MAAGGFPSRQRAWQRQKVTKRRLVQALGGLQLDAAKAQGWMKGADEILSRGLLGRLRWALWKK